MIRAYRPSDCEAVLEVWASASAVAHPFLSREFLQQERQNIREIYLPRAQTWVWEEKRQVAAFLSLLGDEVGAIFVDPRFHRSGIGRQLIAHAQKLRGDLELEVFVENSLGRAFYAKMGFQVIDRKMHELSGFEVLRLRLPVDDAGRQETH